MSCHSDKAILWVGRHELLPCCVQAQRSHTLLPPGQTGTDYGPYLANEPSPLHTTTIVDRCTQKLVDDWNKMRTNVSAHTAAVLLEGRALRLWSLPCAALHDW